MTTALILALRKIILIVKDEVGWKFMTMYNKDLHGSQGLARALKLRRAW